jgi:hypothetical protein
VKAVVVILLGQFAGGQEGTQLTVCAIWLAMFGSGSRICITAVTMVHQLMVQLGNLQQALPGFVAAVPGATVLGACGRLFAATTRLPNANTWASGFASLDRCARSLALCPCG